MAWHLSRRAFLTGAVGASALVVLQEVGRPGSAQAGWLRLDPATPTPAAPVARGREATVFGSSRFFYDPGQGGHIGTLDFIKEFDVHENAWTYITDPADVSSIRALGVGFQGTLNVNMGSGGRAKAFDGSNIIAPWMASAGTTWGSMSDPVYYQNVLIVAKARIDDGVDSFQFDDWLGNVRAYEWSGDFCAASLANFRDYLDANYSTAQLSTWGVDDVSTFDYHAFLQTELGISTVQEYEIHKNETPLDAVFKEFQRQETIRFHTELRADLDSYAGHTIEYTNNTSFFTNPAVANNFLHDVFDRAIGESPSVELSHAVADGAITLGLGKPFTASPLPVDTASTRAGIVNCYATGSNTIVPWDIYINGSTRYFGTREQYGDLFEFIDQYPYALSGLTPPAGVAVLLNWSSLDVGTFRDLAMRLFAGGVPFRVITSNASAPSYPLSSGQFDGVTELICYSSPSSLSSADQSVVTGSGATQVSLSSVDAGWITARSVVNTSSPAVLASVRTRGSSPECVAVHLINTSGVTLENVTVTIPASLVDGVGDSAPRTLRPGHGAELADVSGGTGTLTISIAAIAEWAIVTFADHDDELAPFPVPLPWHGTLTGRPVGAGAATLAPTGELVLSSDGTGLGIATSGDTGSQDQVTFVYQPVEATPLRNYRVTSAVAMSADAESGSSAGLMIRSAAAANAPFVSVRLIAGGAASVDSRSDWDGDVTSTTVTVPSGAVALRLERLGDAITASASATSTFGAALASITVTVVDPLVGLFATGTASNGLGAGVFTSPALELLDYATPAGGILSSLSVTAADASLMVGHNTVLATDASFTTAGGTVTVNVSREELVYSSSNTSVVTVNSIGELLATGVGTATVGATWTVGTQTASGSVTITVLDTTVILDEDFNLPDLSALSGWTISQGPVGSWVAIDPTPSDSDRSLAMYDSSSSGAPSATHTFDAQSGRVTAEFDWRLDFGTSAPTNGGAIVCYLLSPSGGYAVSLLADVNGFWYLEGSTTVRSVAITGGQWYHLKVDAFVTTQKMDLWVDGVKVVDQGAFRSSVTSIGRLQVAGSTGNLDSTIRWNNMYVTAGSA